MDWKKFTFIGLLSLVIFSASFFMVTESARYYTFFYAEGAWQPLYLAGLLELFLLLLAAIKISSNRIFYITQKSIMVGIFFVIIFAAGMQAVKPTLDSLVTARKETQYSEILKQEYENLQRDREVFKDQNQRRNTAIASAERRKIVGDLKAMWEAGTDSNTGAVALTNILLLFIIRFLVQLSNVFSATVLGRYYRKKDKVAKLSEKDQVLQRFPGAKCTKDSNGFVVKAGYRDIGRGNSAKAAWSDAFDRYV